MRYIGLIMKMISLHSTQESEIEEMETSPFGLTF